MVEIADKLEMFKQLVVISVVRHECVSSSLRGPVPSWKISKGTKLVVTNLAKKFSPSKVLSSFQLLRSMLSDFPRLLELACRLMLAYLVMDYFNWIVRRYLLSISIVEISFPDASVHYFLRQFSDCASEASSF